MTNFVQVSEHRWINLDGVTHLESIGGQFSIYHGEHRIELADGESADFGMWLYDNAKQVNTDVKDLD